jgi:methionyl-tRNA formyltransferase
MSARVSDAVYGGTPGRIFYREGDGVAVVPGAEARRGRSRALVVTAVRTHDGREHAAHDYLTSL